MNYQSKKFNNIVHALFHSLNMEGETMKYLIITKKHIMLVCALLLTVTVAAAGSAVIFAGSDRRLPIYCVETDKKQIAISFDAAWGNSKKVQNLYYVNFSNL